MKSLETSPLTLDVGRRATTVYAPRSPEGRTRPLSAAVPSAAVEVPGPGTRSPWSTRGRARACVVEPRVVALNAKTSGGRQPLASSSPRLTPAPEGALSGVLLAAGATTLAIDEGNKGFGLVTYPAVKTGPLVGHGVSVEEGAREFGGADDLCTGLGAAAAPSCYRSVESRAVTRVTHKAGIICTRFCGSRSLAAFPRPHPERESGKDRPLRDASGVSRASITFAGFTSRCTTGVTRTAQDAPALSEAPRLDLEPTNATTVTPARLQALCSKVRDDVVGVLGQECGHRGVALASLQPEPDDEVGDDVVDDLVGRQPGVLHGVRHQLLANQRDPFRLGQPIERRHAPKHTSAAERHHEAHR